MMSIYLGSDTALDVDAEREVGRIQAMNTLRDIAEHLETAGATLHEFLLAANTNMSLAAVQRTWPVRQLKERQQMSTKPVTVPTQRASVEQELERAVNARFAAQAGRMT